MESILDDHSSRLKAGKGQGIGRIPFSYRQPGKLGFVLKRGIAIGR